MRQPGARNFNWLLRAHVCQLAALAPAHEFTQASRDLRPQVSHTQWHEQRVLKKGHRIVSPPLHKLGDIFAVDRICPGMQFKQEYGASVFENARSPFKHPNFRPFDICRNKIRQLNCAQIVQGQARPRWDEGTDHH